MQPYDNFTQHEAKSLCKDIKKGIKSVFACTIDTVKVLPNKQLPQSAYYKPRNRYLANVLLRDLPETANPIYIIGLTHKDISFKIHNSENYGIMGLTPLAKNKSIVSDYRVKGKDFIAVIVHEFGHGLYGATHCSDKNCIMCDYQKLKESHLSSHYVITISICNRFLISRACGCKYSSLFRIQQGRAESPMVHIAQGKRSDTLGFPHSKVYAPCKGKSLNP